jgi:hypothetical protein
MFKYTESKKIKIVLLGTEHFTPSTKDIYKNEPFDLKQGDKFNELQDVINLLSAFMPSQICIEVNDDAQSKIDQQFSQFLQHTYIQQHNEIDLIAYPVAQKIGLKSLTCVNHEGNFDDDEMITFARNNAQETVLTDLKHYVELYIDDLQTYRQTHSLKQQLNYLNTPFNLNKNAAIYTSFLAKIGREDQYPGTTLIADWYKTNLHIYTNIIRNIRAEDAAILVILGHGHIPILTHLFESNLNFELVPVQSVLK